jgi:hypothetical protein
MRFGLGSLRQRNLRKGREVVEKLERKIRSLRGGEVQEKFE